jgi:hypothetical protein
MKNIRTWIISLVIVALAGGTMMTMALPQIASAATAHPCETSFLGFPAWFRGLTVSDFDSSQPDNCNIVSPSSTDAPTTATKISLTAFVWRIALNILQIAVVVVIYTSSIFFLWGGWLFIISRGKPEGAAKARLTLTQAVIGLVVAVSAFAIIEFIGSRIITTL